MLNKIFISHWKITLMVVTVGSIAISFVAAMYWLPPLAKLVEIPISVEQLTQDPNQNPVENAVVFPQKTSDHSLPHARAKAIHPSGTQHPQKQSV